MRVRKHGRRKFIKVQNSWIFPPYVFFDKHSRIFFPLFTVSLRISVFLKGHIYREERGLVVPNTNVYLIFLYFSGLIDFFSRFL
jgi:hypothetical protein